MFESVFSLANINALARIGWLASLISFTLPRPIWYSPHVPGLIFNSEKLNGRPTISTEEYLSLCTKFHIHDTNSFMIWLNHNNFSRAISLRSTRAYRPNQSSTKTATLLANSEFGQFCRHYYFFWWCNWYRVQPLPSRFAKSWEHVRFMTLMYSLNLNQSSLQKKHGLIKLVRMRMRRVSRGEVRGGRLGCAKNLWIAA